ncbi:MAG: LLM class flavin-dependent oxidoreductase [bacterium]|nr:LLM class flavin-dependent oxidoreductase [bacterium]MDE0290053.1 LLM class flavin-dependent oxidoreductase [bacterium]MDE0438223.1 LLM class flavin-dependent oxidoreductase [bacterium]
MKFGVLLPHFGSQASFARLMEGVVEAEELGYDSVWVRDHLVYWPHDYEDPDRTWFDPYVVLSGAAASTTRLVLGTATLIPYRHPIHETQMLASLASLAGPGRVIAGWGRGNDDREFAAAGFAASKERRRGARLEEHLDIIRALWRGEPLDYSGEFYKPFSDVQVTAPALDHDIPHWYGGGSAIAIQRTVRAFDGLLASRLPRDSLRRRIDYMKELSAAQDKPVPVVALVAYVSPADESGDGMSHVDLDRMIPATRARHPKSSFEETDDLGGIVSTGQPPDIARNLISFARLGVSHFIIDLRTQFNVWERSMRMVAAEVIPEVRDSSLR